jgi:hypothetical protein
MGNPAVRRVCREAGVPDLLDRLSGRVTGSDLGSLLLELSRMRSATRALPELTAQWDRDRTVRPATTDPRMLGRLVLAAFDAAPTYEPVQLLRSNRSA